MTLPPDEYHSRQLKYAHLEKVAGAALEQCGVLDSKLSFISDTGNVIFRGDAVNQSYCVRVYPEPLYSIPEINGELYWLLDLRKNTDLIVPEPLKNTSGVVVQEVAAPDNGNKFQVVIFHWIPGDVIGPNLDTKTVQHLGGLMAKLHTHADNFVLPADSFRENTDWRGMGQLRAGLTPHQIARIESFFDQDQLSLCDAVAQRAAATINEIDIQHNFGLIHSDLHTHNCLNYAGKIAIIDFDDCHFAPFSGDMAITISSFDDFPDREIFHLAFLEGYAAQRELPQNYIKEIEAFAIERRLRFLRWIATWPSVNYFPFGRQFIQNALLHFGKYIEA